MLSKLFGFFSAAAMVAAVAWWANPDVVERAATTAALDVRAAALSTSPTYEGRKAAGRAAAQACLSRPDARWDVCRAEAMRMLTPDDKARLDAEQDAQIAAARERFDRRLDAARGK